MDATKLETMTIEDLGLNARAYHALNANEPRSRSKVKLERDSQRRILVKSVIAYTANELVSGYGTGLWNFGRSSLENLEAKLAEHGLHLAQ